MARQLLASSTALSDREPSACGRVYSTVAETFAIKIIVRDSSGAPQKNARVSTRFIKWMKDEKLRAMSPHAQTNERGLATLVLEDEGKPIVLLGYSDDWQLGGYVVVDRSHEGLTVELGLQPTTMLRTSHSCNELPSALKYSITELSLEGLSHGCIGFHTRAQQIEFPVPRGEWSIRRYGKYFLRQSGKITADESLLDLGNIDFEPTGFAKLDGELAPELSLADVRGLPADIKISDHAGKWLLLAFWGNW